MPLSKALPGSLTTKQTLVIEVNAVRYQVPIEDIIKVEMDTIEWEAARLSSLLQRDQHMMTDTTIADQLAELIRQRVVFRDVLTSTKDYKIVL